MTPRKLSKIIKEKGTYHAIAEELGVNVYYVHRYMTQDIEPQNNNIRAKMFLPIKKKRKSRAGQKIPKFMMTWRNLDTRQRNKLIVEALRKIEKLK